MVMMLKITLLLMLLMLMLLMMMLLLLNLRTITNHCNTIQTILRAISFHH